MANLDDKDTERRLRVLYEDLGEFPPGVACPWPVGRVFNELLKQVKRLRADDPVISAIAFLREPPSDMDGAAGGAQVGTVRTLSGQLVAAVSGPPSVAPAVAKKATTRTAKTVRAG